MNALSLFSGIGGLDLGLEAAGFTVVGLVEKDDYCRRVLANHWPEVPLHDDVNTTTAWWLGEFRPRVDLVFGGFPCQGHSVAGKQRGTFDDRWGWPGFRQVIDDFDAPLALIENVPNLARTGLDDVLRDLADLGFDAWWGRVPAAGVGAPHLRWRLFVIAAHPDRVGLRVEPRWRSAEAGASTSLVGFDGATWSLADPTSGDGGPGLREGGAREEAAWVDLTELGDGGERRPDAVAEPEGVGRGTGGLGSWGGEAWTAPPGAGPWAFEPDVGRVAHGVPASVDRLRTLGNAVVPQVAHYVGSLITTTFEVLQ